MLLKEFYQLLQNKIIFPALRCKERSPYFCFLKKIGLKNNPIDMFDLETKQQMNLKIKEIQEHLAHIKELREELKYTDNLCNKIEELINKKNLEKKVVVKDRTLKYLKDILQNKKDIDSFYEVEINDRMGESVFNKIKFFTSLQKIVTLDGNIADDLLQRVNRDELPILQEGRDLKLNLLLSILVLKMMGTLNELQLRTIIEDLKERAKTEIKNNQSEVAKIKTEINDLLRYLKQGSFFQQGVKFKSESAFLKSLQELETKIIRLFKSELQYVLDHGYIIGNLITFIKLAVKQVMPREAEFMDKDLKELRNREFLLLRDAMFKISLPPEIADLVNIDNIQLSRKNIFRMLLRIH
ncbi:hypothetical protein TUBRATIS_007660 [Tubulinosema ratisbonensis]|uniref:Uncharacterized protein n=1 Tax=Tubulinosema ratisbonensis TaxID=291195 RepID=A0A437ANZ3_9MICR|nr:hypothetical protein TUBRATIS_007660 [Tubulinosema ratisbonensis]